MEKKYLVVVYRNLHYKNSYVEFTNKQQAEHWYKYMLRVANGQRKEERDKNYYIIDVRLYELTEIGE